MYTIVLYCIAATVCRFLLVIRQVAWTMLEQSSPERFAGAFGSYFVGDALCVAMVAGL